MFFREPPDLRLAVFNDVLKLYDRPGWLVSMMIGSFEHYEEGLNADLSKPRFALLAVDVNQQVDLITSCLYCLLYALSHCSP